MRTLQLLFLATLFLFITCKPSSGDGLSHHEGYAIFTPGSIPGDRVKGKVTKITPRFGVIDILERSQSSQHRADPPCPVFFKCGDCKFQNLSYKKQIQFKN